MGEFDQGQRDGANRPGQSGAAIHCRQDSFTLVSGVLTDEYTAGGVIGTVINHIVEGFTKAAAVELPRGVRINCISPTVLTESVTYHPFFPGFIPVEAREVGQAYVRAISNPFTGRILKLHKTDS